MPWSLFKLYAFLPAFVLVLARISGLMLATPFFSGAAIPRRIKVTLAVAMTLAVFPMLISYVPPGLTLGSAVSGLIGELAIGLFVGIGITLIFMGIQIGANLVGQQSGMRLGNVFNPLSESSGSLLAQLYFFVAMMVFLSVGGHRAVVRALLESFVTVPLMGFQVNENLLELVVSMCGLSFSIAIRVAGPAILALMLAFMTLGFISRTVPQINILTVGFPVKLAVALLILAMTTMSLEPLLMDALSLCLDGIRSGLGLAPVN